MDDYVASMLLDVVKHSQKQFEDLKNRVEKLEEELKNSKCSNCHKEIDNYFKTNVDIKDKVEECKEVVKDEVKEYSIEDTLLRLSDLKNILNGSKTKFLSFKEIGAPGSVFRVVGFTDICLKITGVRKMNLRKLSVKDVLDLGVELLFSDEEIDKDPRLGRFRGYYRNYRLEEVDIQDLIEDLDEPFYSYFFNPIESFISLWDKIHFDSKWASNPTVFLHSFKITDITTH